MFPAGLGMYTSDAIALLHHIPLLLAHGTNDFVISKSNSEVLHEIAAKTAQNHKINGNLEPLFIVEGALHCGLENAGGDEFKRRLLGVFAKWTHLPCDLATLLPTVEK